MGFDFIRFGLPITKFRDKQGSQKVVDNERPDGVAPRNKIINELLLISWVFSVEKVHWVF